MVTYISVTWKSCLVYNKKLSISDLMSYTKGNMITIFSKMN